ncbi:10117_t:CDS:2, partial [Acaulospora morrowiae]
ALCRATKLVLAHRLPSLELFDTKGSLPSHKTGVGTPVTSLELSDAKGSLPTQHRTHWARVTSSDLKPDLKKAREWEEKRSRDKTYIHQPIFGNRNVVGFDSNINSGTFTELSKRESNDAYFYPSIKAEKIINKKLNVSVKKVKATSGNIDYDIDYPFISDNRAINLAESSDFSKDNSSISSSIRGSVSFDNPFNNSIIFDDNFMLIQPKQKRNLSLPKKADDDKDLKLTDSSSKQRKKSSEKV